MAGTQWPRHRLSPSSVPGSRNASCLEARRDSAFSLRPQSVHCGDTLPPPRHHAGPPATTAICTSSARSRWTTAAQCANRQSLSSASISRAFSVRRSLSGGRLKPQAVRHPGVRLEPALSVSRARAGPVSGIFSRAAVSAHGPASNEGGRHHAASPVLCHARSHGHRCDYPPATLDAPLFFDRGSRRSVTSVANPSAAHTACRRHGMSGVNSHSAQERPFPTIGRLQPRSAPCTFGFRSLPQLIASLAASDHREHVNAGQHFEISIAHQPSAAC